jgi:uncharacterized protein YijF (DUF1287 family)
VATAVKAARDDKKAIELWRGAKFQGTAISDTEVCVNQTLTKAAGDQIGMRAADRKSYVIVTLPEGTLSEPQVGTCADVKDADSGGSGGY